MAETKEAKKVTGASSDLTVGKIVVYVTYGVVVFAEIVLGFRIFFLLFNANANTPFVRFIYNTSNDFLAPFRGIFLPHDSVTGGYLDVSALFALIVYAIIAVLIQSLMRKLDSRS
ncbi:YggT family protein [Candidatus Saccharibacteria bacterium]|nr:YggT family protein [Candidatus Saccharibacteria bacterium]